MDNSIQEMILVGHYSFNSKDKNNKYFVAQCLYSNNDLSNGNLKGTMINVFCNADEYERIKELNIGTILKVQVSSSFETGKLYYKLVV